MADQASIFESSNQPVTPAQPGAGTPTSQAPDELTTMLMSIKNENGEPKYRTLQDAIVALKHSQEYIPQLKLTLSQREQELETARREAARVAEVERSLEELTQSKNTPATPGSGLTEENIADLVTKTITRREQEAVRKANLKTVVDAVGSKFGTEAEKMFYGKAKELGLSVQEFNEFAAKSPTAVLALLDVRVDTRSALSPTQSSVNTAGLQPNPNSNISSNQRSVMLGATTQDVIEESRAAGKMVEELHAQGKSMQDLTDPKTYFKMFKH